jgi:hypothetical protein
VPDSLVVDHHQSPGFKKTRMETVHQTVAISTEYTIGVLHGINRRYKQQQAKLPVKLFPG